MARKYKLDGYTTGLWENMPEPLNKIAPVVQKRVSQILAGMLGYRLTIQDALAMSFVRGFEDAVDAMGLAEDRALDAYTSDGEAAGVFE